ncbi:MAG: hypothetical protein LBF88_09880 [Planctomycetaceae bacterium]|jgi:hypothetical protein|nr:hypothetical protein [Planctomycetaceae bacterium]
MSKKTLFILITAALLFAVVNTVSAQNDVQSLQTEFNNTTRAITAPPCPCSESTPVVIAPNPYRGLCCPQPYPCYRPVTCCPQPYSYCRPLPCYSPCYTPAPVIYRRAGLRPLFFHRYYHRYYSACCY